MAYGARLALYRAGLRIPDDLSLVGFDDLFHSAYTLPPLTTVRQSSYDIGVAAAHAIVQLINGKKPKPKLQKAELIIRETTIKVQR